jgi:hypothetical protein
MDTSDEARRAIILAMSKRQLAFESARDALIAKRNAICAPIDILLADIQAEYNADLAMSRDALAQLDAERRRNGRRAHKSRAEQELRDTIERDKLARRLKEEAATPNMPPNAFLDRDDNDELVFSFWIDDNNTAPWRRVRPDDPARPWAEQQYPNRAERARRQAQNQADQDKYRSGLPSQEERNAARHALNGPDKPLEYDKYGNLILPPPPPYKKDWN